MSLPPGEEAEGRFVPGQPGRTDEGRGDRGSGGAGRAGEEPVDWGSAVERSGFSDAAETKTRSIGGRASGSLGETWGALAEERAPEAGRVGQGTGGGGKEKARALGLAAGEES